MRERTAGRRHIERPSADRFYELAEDASFIAAHGGPAAAGAYLHGYADALEDFGIVGAPGARAIRAAAVLGEHDRSALGGAMRRGTPAYRRVSEMLHEVRLCTPEEYCMVNGCGGGDGEAVAADLRARMDAAADDARPGAEFPPVGNAGGGGI